MGILLAAATAAVIWGGVHRIGFITSVMVPVMATIYILIGLVTMALHIRELPQVFAMILENAFDFQAMAGGLAGSAVVIGIKRGLFSNEAGMGSAPNASASAEVDHPVKQGLVQVISVFIDTLLICSSTAMMLLVSGVEGKPEVLDGIPFVQAAIRENVGEWGIHFITFSIFAFAFSSLVGNYYYAESNILFIKNNKVLLFFLPYQLYRGDFPWNTGRLFPDVEYCGYYYGMYGDCKYCGYLFVGRNCIPGAGSL